MHDSPKSVPLPSSGRLRRVTATTVSGPDVLARRHFAALHLRWDRERFGHTGPAAGGRWSHFAAIVIVAVACLAIAGSH